MFLVCEHLGLHPGDPERHAQVVVWWSVVHSVLRPSQKGPLIPVEEVLFDEFHAMPVWLST